MAYFAAGEAADWDDHFCERLWSVEYAVLISERTELSLETLSER